MVGEDPLEKEMADHSSIHGQRSLAGSMGPTGSQNIGHD